MKTKISNALLIWLFESKEFVVTLPKYWLGGLSVVVSVLLTFVYTAPPLLHISNQSYTNGILTCSFIAWLFGFWAFILTRKLHEIPPATDKHVSLLFHGNRNWQSGTFAVFATGIFWLLGTPTLTLIIVGVLQFLAFGFGDKYQQQTRYLRHLAIAALFVLAIWIIAA